MAKANRDWKVLAHDPVRKLADNLWWVQGSLKGMSLKRVMAIARLPAGELVIHNGIALDDASMQEIEAWGTPRYLIVPNGGHRLDAPAYKQRYPGLTVLTPKGSVPRVAEVVDVDGTYDDFPKNDTVWFQTLAGVAEAEGAMFVRSPDGVSVVLNDAVFNMDRKRDPLGFVFTTLLGSAPGPRVSRLVKLLFVKDKAALRADLEKLAQTPQLERLIVAHEKVAHGRDAAAALRRAARYL